MPLPAIPIIIGAITSIGSKILGKKPVGKDVARERLPEPAADTSMSPELLVGIGAGILILITIVALIIVLLRK